MKHIFTIFTFATTLLLTGCQSAGGPFEVENQAQPQLKSPNGKSVVNLTLVKDQPNWSVNFGTTQILKPSALGLQTESKLGKNGFKVIGCAGLDSDEIRKTVWGKHSQIRNHYRELIWQLQEIGVKKRRLDLIIRAYNDGVAVRYKIHGTGKETVTGDKTCFDFTGDYTCWSANGERPNHGPVKLSKYRGRQYPLTVEINENTYCSILEAAIYDYAHVAPKRIAKTAFRNSLAKSKVTLPSSTSWRVLLLGDRPGALIESNVLTNLNPPCKIKDTSWIKPGLAMWDWRSWGGASKDGFKYNLDMASWRLQIDFASKNNVKYLVLDANWYGHEFDKKSNPMKSRDYIVYQPNPKSPKMADRPAPKDWKDPIDVPALIKYGKEKNVGIILYINDVARYNWDFKKTLATYKGWGAAGIKYGFMKGKGQKKVTDTREIVKLCAENHLLCDFHDGPVPPSGDRRTWPNYVVREFCHGQCDATRSFTPRTFCTTVFCNMLAGPLDMCNGFFSLNGIEKVRPKVFKPVNSTVVAEAARVMITFSGLAILPDTPESYESKADLFTFLSKLPMKWDETRILNGKIGEYITTARRSGDNWYIASACNESGTELPINLDFLKEGETYEVTLYEDAQDSHYINNKEAYRIHKIKVKKGDIIKAKLAPGGGHCMTIELIKFLSPSELNDKVPVPI